jgi:exopolysaccharide production protein ExoQ
MGIRRKLMEDAFMLVVLFLATGAFQTFAVDHSDLRSVDNGSRFMEILWVAVYGVVVLRLIPQSRLIITMVRANKFLLLLVLLAVSSTIWSGDPGLTLRRTIALVATTLIGIDFAVRYSVRDQLRLLYIVLGLVVSLGIVAQLFFPRLIPGVDFDSAAWHGLWSAKNEWGRIVVLSAVAVFSRSRRSLRDFVLIGCLALLAFGLIVLAHSIGSLVILVAMLLLFRVFPALRWRPKILAKTGLAAALIVLPISYLLFQNLDKVTAIFGRDASLTGRVDIWQLVLPSIEKSPILGYGYSAFWLPDSQTAERIREELNWAGAPHAHNGFIDMALGLGFSGLLLLLASYLVAARRALEWFHQGAEREAVWPLVYLSFFLLYQFTEWSLVAENNIYWILYVAVCFSVTRITVTEQPALTVDSEFSPSRQMFPSGQEQALQSTD